MNDASKKGILVLGAGELGTAVIGALARQPSINTDITVLLSPSSDPNNASLPASKRTQLDHFTNNLGIQIHPFDLHNSNAPDLTNIFRTYHTIISCTGFSGPSRLQKKIADSALAAGVRYFIPWQFGVDYDLIGTGSAQELFTEQLEVRALLRGQSATAWNIVSVGVFMSFLFEPGFGVVDVSEKEDVVVRALGKWEYELTATTAEDIGKCVAELVARRMGDRADAVADGVVFVAGDTVSYAYIARVVEETASRPVRRELWDLAYLKNELAKDPENGLIKYRCIWAEGVGVAWDKSASFNGQKNIQMKTVSEYAKRKLR